MSKYANLSALYWEHELTAIGLVLHSLFALWLHSSLFRPGNSIKSITFRFACLQPSLFIWFLEATILRISTSGCVRPSVRRSVPSWQIGPFFGGEVSSDHVINDGTMGDEVVASGVPPAVLVLLYHWFEFSRWWPWLLVTYSFVMTSWRLTSLKFPCRQAPLLHKTAPN